MANSPTVDRRGTFRDPAFMANRSRPVHRWVPWIAGYSRDFVVDALNRHLSEAGTVLDPFAGVGTTLVEADLAGHKAVGFEINPYAVFAARMKLNAHKINSAELEAAIGEFRDFMSTAEQSGMLPVSKPPSRFRTRAPFYSAEIEKKVLLVLDFALGQPREISDLFRLAFASLMVTFSNYSYEPSLGHKSSAGKADVEDYPIADAITEKLLQISEDAKWYSNNRKGNGRANGTIHGTSFFSGYSDISEGSVDLLITSPPYLNNYHYNRNTRPHLYWLGFCHSPSEMKQLEELNFGTYWQNARSEDRVELNHSVRSPNLRATLASIEQQNPDRGVYGGRGWANYAARYFNDCVRFADGARWCLRKGGTALVVIGNSILQGIPVSTDAFLGELAVERGLDLVEIHIPRNSRVGSSIINSSVRAGQANGHRLYESVVELRKP